MIPIHLVSLVEVYLNCFSLEFQFSFKEILIDFNLSSMTFDILKNFSPVQNQFICLARYEKIDDNIFDANLSLLLAKIFLLKSLSLSEKTKVLSSLNQMLEILKMKNKKIPLDVNCVIWNFSFFSFSILRNIFLSNKQRKTWSSLASILIIYHQQKKNNNPDTSILNLKQKKNFSIVVFII